MGMSDQATNEVHLKLKEAHHIIQWTYKPREHTWNGPVSKSLKWSRLHPHLEPGHENYECHTNCSRKCCRFQPQPESNSAPNFTLKQAHDHLGMGQQFNGDISTVETLEGVRDVRFHVQLKTRYIARKTLWTNQSQQWNVIKQNH